MLTERLLERLKQSQAEGDRVGGKLYRRGERRTWAERVVESCDATCGGRILSEGWRRALSAAKERSKAAL